MAKVDNAETTLKLKVPVLENDYKTLVRKYQEVKEKNSKLVFNYVCKLHNQIIIIKCVSTKSP